MVDLVIGIYFGENFFFGFIEGSIQTHFKSEEVAKKHSILIYNLYIQKNFIIYFAFSIS